MKALILTDYNKLEWLDVDKPQYGEQDVLIRVVACAVCGSDAHGVDGSTGRRKPPIIMGHEAAGVIEACGAGVEDWKPGDRVTFDSTIYCGQCEECLAGRINLCKHRRVLGVSCDEYRQNGAFAEYVSVPAHLLYRLPDNVSFEQASMVEPLSVAYHAVMRAPVPVGGSAAVIGAGTIGMMAVQVLRAKGVRQIIVVDIVPDKLAFALQNGADYVLNSAEPDIVARMRILTKNSAGVDACYDATGLQQTLQTCLDAVKAGGSVVLIGNFAKQVDLSLQQVVTNQLTLYGSCASAGEYDKCLDMISAGRVNVDALTSAVVPMAEGAEWIRRLRAGEKGLTKIIMRLPERTDQ